MSGRERLVCVALATTVLGSAGFIAAYVAAPLRLYEGISLALAAAGLCLAAVGWALWIVPDEQVVDEIEDYPSSPIVRVDEIATIAADTRKVSRPRALVYLLGAALGALGAALIVPIRSLGRAPDGALFHTKWRSGDRLVRPDGSVVRAGDLNVDSAVAVFPEGAIGDEMSQVMLIRLPGAFASATQGYVAYSRVCTHAGCPVALYRAAAKELMCPCHQSIFDVIDGGEVVSGPADRPLPRLPIAVGPNGVLHATGDFSEPVGPGFWERG
jgi:ubiquinol-cytochrome c reductase iron-sulfur subunit